MFLEEAVKIEEILIKHYKHLHQCPELGFELHQTSAYVKEQLEQLGLVVEVVATTGLTTTIGKPGGKCILLRADMDALEIVEESGLPFASVNGLSHSCGHDSHMSMLLGAAQLLLAHKSELNGCVKLVFQPDEEGYQGGGAKRMIEDGICDGVDVAMAIHSNPLIDVGRIETVRGPILASQDSIRITVKGIGGHGATPERAIDPIYVAHMIYSALQEIFVREISAKEPAVFTICQFHSGNAFNVIPDEAVMAGTIRCFNEKIRSFIKKRIAEVSHAVASAYRTSVEIEYVREMPATINDSALMDCFHVALQTEFGVGNLETNMEQFMVSEDFSLFAEKIPSVMMFVGFGHNNDQQRYFLHHPHVVFDTSGLKYGASAFACVAYEWLKQQKGEQHA